MSYIDHHQVKSKPEAYPVRLLSITLLAATVVISGCSLTGKTEKGEEPRAEYRQTRSGSGLETPPDLTRLDSARVVTVPGGKGGVARYSEYAATVSGEAGSIEVLPSVKNVALKREGDHRWLEVGIAVESVWPRVRNFWIKDGVKLTIDSASAGVIETDWMENLAIIENPLTKAFRKVAGDLLPGVGYDKYRIRVERGATEQITEIYLTHRGMKDVASSGAPRWQLTEADSELEAEMLRRLMVYLGIETKRAEATEVATPTKASRAKKVADGEAGSGLSALQLEDSFSSAWRRVGIALDRLGFTLEDRSRKDGTYFLRITDMDQLVAGEEDILTTLFGIGKNKVVNVHLRVVVLSVEGGSLVAIRNQQGQPDSSKIASNVLALLLEQLR